MLIRSLFLLSFLSLVGAGFYWLGTERPEALLVEIKVDEMPAPLENPKGPALKESLGPKREPVRQFTERKPAAENEGDLAEFEGRSRGRWVIKKGESGFATRLAEARFFQEASSPGEAAREFVQRYGRAVFGAGPEAMGNAIVVKEEEGAQVRIPQKLNSLPVLGAELNLIYDNEGNLIFAASSMYSGGDVPAAAPAINVQAAATAARAALSSHFSSKGAPLRENELSIPALMNSGSLAYRMSGNRLALVYRYELVMDQPRFGDIELIVDAAVGGVVAFRELSRK